MINIKTFKHFDKRAIKLNKKYPSFVSDLENLCNELQLNPRLGISLGYNLYKIRLKNSSKNSGKRGYYRIITFYKDDSDKNLYLVDIYDKSDLDNVGKDFLKKIISEELGV